MSETLKLGRAEFVREVESRSGTRVSACLQCHKCSSGCPTGPDMELLPSQVMRMIVLGQEDELLRSPGIWSCASCEACTTRCPMAIDIAAVMDTLRMLAVERKAVGDKVRGQHFNAAFLASVRRHGRVFEAGMMTGYKLRSGDLLADVDKVPGMLLKGKLPLLPRGSKSAAAVRRAFKGSRNAEEQP